MRYYCLFVFFFAIRAASAQLNTFYVDPQTVDPLYAASDDSCYIAINSAVATNNKLLVFLPGTGAKTKHYKLFVNQAANIGYHCISLSYTNEDAAAGTCSASSDEDCFVNYRQEICYGSDASEDVDVDEFNCIRTRLVKVLQYLNTTYPSQGWGQFLNGTDPAWNQVAVSGHSQGSGHALYLGKTQPVERVIMFAGANDYSLHFNQAANWISALGLTPSSRYFSLLHKDDDVFSYAYQFQVMNAAGMLDTDDSTRIDNMSPPYGQSHCLYTTTAPANASIPSAEHNGMVVDFYVPTSSGQPVYAPAWVYMLSASLVGLDEVVEDKLKMHPNPAHSNVNLQFSQLAQNETLVLSDCHGKELERITGISGNNYQLGLANCEPGLYFVAIQGSSYRIVVQ